MIIKIIMYTFITQNIFVKVKEFRELSNTFINIYDYYNNWEINSKFNNINELLSSLEDNIVYYYIIIEKNKRKQLYN